MTKCSAVCRRPKGAEAHCSACHNGFGSLGAFDAHRSDGWCLDPAGLGYLLQEGLWATPEGHAHRRELAARMESARATRGGK